MPVDLSTAMPETSSMLEWIAGFLVLAIVGISLYLLTRTLPAAFKKIEELGVRFEQSHEKNTEKLSTTMREGFEGLRSEIREISHDRSPR